MIVEKINEMISGTCSEDTISLELFEDFLFACGDVAYSNYRLEVNRRLGRHYKKDEEYRELVTKLTREKEKNLESATLDLIAINRICKQKDMALIFNEDIEDKVKVNEFIYNVVDELKSHN